MLLMLLLVAFHATQSFATSGDLTLQPGTSGSVVVEAVTDRIEASCVFPEDKMLLRRVAYVETFDGKDEKTYRDGYHGGIWQVRYWYY